MGDALQAGQAVGSLKRLGPARGTGTIVYFHPDATIFPKVEFDPEVIKERLEVVSYLHKGVKVTFHDETSKTKSVFEHTEGIVDYLKKIVAERTAKPVHESPFVLSKDEGLRLELVLQWTEATDEHLRSYVNGIPTGSGGTHENGLRAGIGKAVRNFIDTHNLTPKGVTLTAEDIREGMTGILSLFISEPQFQGQTKDRLNNPEILSAVDGVVRPGAGALAEPQHQRRRVDSRAHHPRGPRPRSEPGGAGGSLAQERDILAPQSARQTQRLHKSDKRRQRAVHRRGRFGRRFSQAGTRSRAAGHSAAARQGAQHRERLAGEGPGEQGALRSRDGHRLRTREELRAREATLRKDHHPCRRRFGRQSHRDAAAHVHLPASARLIGSGNVFLAQPPLYRIDIGKDTFWALDDAQKDAILKQHSKNGNRATPDMTRFKGLGEMMPKVLWETTLNPRTRRLLRVEIVDQLITDRVINELMGKDASARFRFIMERAEEAEELDV